MGLVCADVRFCLFDIPSSTTTHTITIPIAIIKSSSKVAVVVMRLPLIAVPLRATAAPCEPEQYIIKDPSEAFRRVLWSNPRRGDFSKSLIGPTGHAERSNAWSHAFAALVFATYTGVRQTFVPASTAATLSGLAAGASALTFLVSTLYHIHAPVPECIELWRTLDISLIYVSAAATSLADVTLVTHFVAPDTLPAQCLLDPVLAAGMLAVYFVVRRIVVPASETKSTMRGARCADGLFRTWSSDLEHAPLRASGMALLGVFWTMLVPAATYGLSFGGAVLFVATRAGGLLLLVGGNLLDNLQLLEQWSLEAVKGCKCSSRRLGCVAGSHFWWHVLSALAAVATVVSRDVVLASPRM